jgi:uncharacterized protein
MNKWMGLCSAGLLTFAAGAADAACASGVYGNGDKERVVITNPIGAGAKTRYTFIDGRKGDVNAEGGLVECENDQVRMKEADGRFTAWNRVKIRETPVHFTSHDTKLSGVLMESEHPGRKPPLVVFVHGSERWPAIGFYYPYVLAAQGLSVLVYDKRGTGSSEGEYTQNFELLADDATAALDEARRVAAGRYSRAGYFGGSQGGWVAPLAAKRAHADFVAVGFGLVMTPLEEDREQVFKELREKHADDVTLAHAREVTDATGAVMASHFVSGYDQLAWVKKRYGSEVWFKDIHGEFTGRLLHEDEADLRRTGAARMDNLNILWRYDAVAAIHSLDIPQLWVIAGEDREAPGEITRERLAGMVRDGKRIDLYVFPHTDHGIYEFTEDADGKRVLTRVADGYFRLLGDWIKQDFRPPYGRAEQIH